MSPVAVERLYGMICPFGSHGKRIQPQWRVLQAKKFLTNSLGELIATGSDLGTSQAQQISAH